MHHCGEAFAERAGLLELWIDLEGSGIVDVAPAVADPDRREPFREDTGFVKSRIDRDFAFSIDISPFLPLSVQARNLREPAHRDGEGHAKVAVLDSIELRRITIRPSLLT